MPFNFPNNPIEGEIFQSPGGPVYIYRTPVWEMIQEPVQEMYDEIVVNYSMPTAVNPVVLYISQTGNDNINDDLLHGTTVAKAFATFNAAITHAKTYYRFTGRLSAVEFRFGPGSWGHLFIGQQLPDYGFHGNTDLFPFAIAITSIDDANRASFIGMGISCWPRGTMFVTKVRAAYFVALRQKILTVQDVDIIAAPSPVPYCFRFATGGQIFIWGAVDVLEPVDYSLSFFYGSEG